MLRVFVGPDGRGGNPLGVFLDGSRVAPERRQAMAADTREPVGVYFGTTSGEVWGSRSEGERWTRLASHLPEIYAVEVAEF